jgi:hypothetical protein
MGGSMHIYIYIYAYHAACQLGHRQVRLVARAPLLDPHAAVAATAAAAAGLRLRRGVHQEVLQLVSLG